MIGKCFSLANFNLIYPFKSKFKLSVLESRCVNIFWPIFIVTNCSILIDLFIVLFISLNHVRCTITKLFISFRHTMVNTYLYTRAIFQQTIFPVFLPSSLHQWHTILLLFLFPLLFLCLLNEFLAWILDFPNLFLNLFIM